MSRSVVLEKVIDGDILAIVRNSFNDVPNYSWHCGYVAFEDFKYDIHHRIFDFVPVHGGITFREHGRGRAVFGFDCNHAYSSKSNLLGSLDDLGACVADMFAVMSGEADEYTRSKVEAALYAQREAVNNYPLNKNSQLAMLEAEKLRSAILLFCGYINEVDSATDIGTKCAIIDRACDECERKLEARSEINPTVVFGLLDMYRDTEGESE